MINMETYDVKKISGMKISKRIANLENKLDRCEKEITKLRNRLAHYEEYKELDSWAFSEQLEEAQDEIIMDIYHGHEDAIREYVRKQLDAALLSLQGQSKNRLIKHLQSKHCPTCGSPNMTKDRLLNATNDVLEMILTNACKKCRNKAFKILTNNYTK